METEKSRSVADMTYREFIDITKYSECYIDFDDYTDYIEPVYMNCNDEKMLFCSKFYHLHEKYINKIITYMIRTKPHQQKIEFLSNYNIVFKDIADTHILLLKGFLAELDKLYKN